MNDYDKLMEKKNEKYQIGITIAIILAVLTIGEFMLADVGANWVSILILIALIKAFFIIRDFMHLGSVFSSEEEH